MLRPFASGFFEDNQAGHLYKPVIGDFIVTTRLRVSGTQAQLPQTEFSLAALFVRAPHAVTTELWIPGHENWLFFSVGTASPAGEPHYEVKSTTNSLSTLKVVSSQADWVELRIARHGESFRPTTGRFPIAHIDAPTAFGRDIIEARRRDVLSD